MKLSSPRIVALLFVCSPVAWSANLLTNGSFESTPINTASPSGAVGIIDGSTFTGWRFFNVGGPAAATYNGTIVDAGAYSGGTAGSHAFRFDIDTTNSPGGDRALDRDNNRVAISQGQTYTFSFDAELDGVIGANFVLMASLGEFDSMANYLGSEQAFFPALPADQTFHGYSYEWSAQNPATTMINIAFRPQSPGGISAMVLDNVFFGPVPEPTTAATLALAALAGLARRRR